MKSFIFTTLYTFARMVLKPYIESGFFARAEELVISLVNETIAGKEKREKVFEWLTDEYTTINTILVNLVIELTVVNVIKPNAKV